MLAVPGGPYSGERNLPPEIEANFKHRYRVEFAHCTSSIGSSWRRDFRGDLGMSLRLQDYSVNQVIAQGLPISACAWHFGAVLCDRFGVECGHCVGTLSRLARPTSR